MNRTTSTERINNILLWVGVFIGLDALGFGLYHAVLSVSTPIGDINIIHFYTLFLVIFSVLVGHYKTPHRRNGLLLPVMGLFLLVAIEALVSFGHTLFSCSFTTTNLIKNVLQLHIYLYFIPLVLLIRSKRQLLGFVKGLFVIAILGASIIFYQDATGTSLSASKVIYQMSIGSNRLLGPTSALISGSFFTLIALYLSVGLKRVFVPAYLLGLPLLPALLLPLHRGSMVTTIVGLLGVILVVPASRHIKTVRVGVALLLIGVASFLSFSIVGVNPGVLVTRAKSIFTDLPQLGSTANFRVALVRNVWEDVLHNYPLLGRGFDWEPYNYEIYRTTAFTGTPTNDSGFAAMLIVFGLSGIAIYGFIFYRIFKCGIALMRSLLSPRLRALVIGILAYTAATIIGLFSGTGFLGQPATIVLVTSWALLYLMLDFHGKGQLEEG